MIAAALKGLNQRALALRKPVVGYIPRGDRGNVIDSLRLLVGSLAPSITRQQFAEFCEQHFSIKDSSVAATLSMLRGTGLIEQTGLDMFSATALSAAWLESDDHLDLVRILHANILCFGEVLAALDVVDRAPALASYAARAYGMPRLDVSGMRTRLQILNACGLIEEAAFARYRLTPLWEALRETIPLLEPDERLQSASARAAPTIIDHDDIVDASLVVIDELRASATDADHPTRFEKAVTQSLRVLGFDAIHLGGPGDTDIAVEVAIDRKPLRVLIDAKSSASGMVGERAIDFDTLREHKGKRSADTVVVVGPSFTDGRLVRRAKEHGVVLLPVEVLAEVIEQQRTTPLSLRELIVLFSDSPREQLAASWAQRSRETALVTHVLGVLVREAADPDQVFGGALTVDHIYLALRDEVDPRPTLQQIQNVIGFLNSPLVRAVEGVDKKFASIESPRVTADRLRTLAAAIDQVSKLLE